ncbi:uncharacterized protein BJ171DRAFT_608998 [Polychytrium aggregatum]|uniref:uncharacterized protein n=1 Tax=Polychytrium aggregatum TaxID=110093 RepID=UPI0022FE4FB5|nr:uncharacterized protein BJ171DRAFT_608998 [Polychytrium aggregatum]KAI9209730.1 hypothetical protein BJ171DRAFT_608998 [Polychytrium aggregatum]
MAAHRPAAKPAPHSPAATDGKQNCGPPQTADDVEHIMSEMDRLYGTTFKDWIKSEKNVAYLCTYKGHFFKDHSPALYPVLRWITHDWSVAAVAEFVIKLYYNLKLESPQFVAIVASIVGHWSLEKTTDLINIVMIGESAEKCAAFTWRLSRSLRWSLDEQSSVLRSMVKTLSWKQTFTRSFLIRYAECNIDNSTQRCRMIFHIGEEFQSMKPLSPEGMSVASRPDSSSSVFQSLDEYCEIVVSTFRKLGMDPDEGPEMATTRDFHTQSPDDSAAGLADKALAHNPHDKYGQIYRSDSAVDFIEEPKMG